ncbi:MAG: tetratricopeptide repeat protein [Chthoniobacter sp.]|nr:tetratricopeptide repeat protein [Chthoniobacter sp.]
MVAHSADKPRRTPAKPAGAEPPGVAAPAAPVPDHHPEYADAFPSPIRPVPADLALKPEDEKKANALALFAVGLAAEDNADQDAMLERYRKALELDPGNPELAVKVAYELARRNDPSSAIQVLKDAIKAAPKEALPCIYLSQLYAKNLNKPELAIKYAEMALTLAPDDFAALQAVYELYAANGQEKKAAELLDRATKSTSTSGKYWIQLAEMEQGMWLKEEGTAEPAQLEKMNTAFRKAAELGKDDAVILSKVADYYVLSKQIKAAIPVYLSILTLAPDAGDPPLNNVRDKLARCFLVNDQRDEAIKQLEAIVKESPLRFETYELLGELYLQKEDYEHALTSFENGLRLDNGDPASYERLGYLLLRTKRYERAVDILQAARKAHAGRPVLSYMLGIAFSQAKRHDEALAAFADAQSTAETNREDLLNAEFYFSYGAAAEQAGQLEKAVGLLKKSMEMEPNNAQAFNYLGYMWADRNERLDEAGELINKALAIEPENSAYLDSLGWFYYRKGDFDRALKELQKAQAIMQRDDEKEDATVLDHIGETYLKLGKTAEAVSSWQKSLALEKSKKIEDKVEAAKQKLTKGNEPPAPAPQPEK